MEDIEIKELLFQAIRNFYKKEKHFIQDGINEVGIVTRIAIHLDRIIRVRFENQEQNNEHLEVYTEFDRAYNLRTGEITQKQIQTENGDILKVRPDLLLLTMKDDYTINQSLLVLEAKKIGSNKAYTKDKDKIKSFLDQVATDYNYLYQLGVHLILGNEGFVLIWYKSNQPITATIWKLSEDSRFNQETEFDENYTTKTIKAILTR